MSRTPSNPLHHGGWHAYDEPPEPPPLTKAKPGMGKNIRAGVRDAAKVERREEALNKWATTTTALTADERALLRELRQTDADNHKRGGTTARVSAAQIRKAREDKR